jgi:hypothetical protein
MDSVKNFVFEISQRTIVPETSQKTVLLKFQRSRLALEIVHRKNGGDEETLRNERLYRVMSGRLIQRSWGAKVFFVGCHPATANTDVFRIAHQLFVSFRVIRQQVFNIMQVTEMLLVMFVWLYVKCHRHSLLSVSMYRIICIQS